MSSTTSDSETSSASHSKASNSISHISFVHSSLQVKSAIQKVNVRGQSTFSFTYERATNPTMDSLRAKLLKRINDVPIHGTSAAGVMGKQPPKSVRTSILDQPKQTAIRTGGAPKRPATSSFKPPVSKAAKQAQPQQAQQKQPPPNKSVVQPQKPSAPLNKTNFDTTIELVVAQPTPTTPMPAPAAVPPPPTIQQTERDNIIFEAIRRKYGNQRVNSRARRSVVRSLLKAGRIEKK